MKLLVVKSPKVEVRTVKGKEMSIGVYYGSTTGATEEVAGKIADLVAEQNVRLENITVAAPGDLLQYDLLILGTSTWGSGELQDDWASFVEKLDGMDFSGHRVALFGLGDQAGWGDTFVDGMGLLYEVVVGLGAEVVGSWPVTGYDFISSQAESDGKFVGLAIDESNQSELTESRIRDWLSLIV